MSDLNKGVIAENISEFTGEKKHKGFTGKLGFVLAAAGSAVGLGNLWRFPYLAAQYGGGIFLLCYVVLAVFFGVILLMLEIGIGRRTGKSVLGAFGSLNKKFKWFGFMCVIVPIIIVPYYCVIGGWVTKYLYSFIVGSEGVIGAGQSVNASEFFVSFILYYNIFFKKFQIFLRKSSKMTKKYLKL